MAPPRKNTVPAAITRTNWTRKSATASLPCPWCGGPTIVVDSLGRNATAGLRRTRACEQNHRFTTVEYAAHEGEVA